jgi:hypothetical protein
MASTREGFQWTPAAGLEQGLPCEGVIQPPEIIEKPRQVFDVLIIGAGYTGLTAARDLTTTGASSILPLLPVIANPQKASKHYSWKVVTALVAGHGHRTLTVTHSKWAGHGFIGFNRTYTASCHDTA